MLKGSFFMILVTMFYAGNILVGRALNELPPFTIAYTRLLLAFLLLLPFAPAAWRHRGLFWTYRWPFFWMTAAGVTFFNTFIYGSLQYTTAANVAVLETLIPAVTVIAAFLLLHEPLKARQWTGASISFFGALFVITEGRIDTLLTMEWNPGDILMSGAVICWTAYSLLVRKYMHLFPSLAALFLMNFLSILMLLPFIAVEWSLGGVPVPFTLNEISGLLYLGIFPSVVALFLFNKAVAALGAGRSSIFLNLLPVFTIAGSVLLLQEPVSSPQIIGAGVLIAGVMMSTLHSGKG
ncbi:DMT family transporter [Alkalicoccus chagannorensis]|uniref:DMT family transporter n=1 Tax=Alkalicoccus chagannorensis TaxID=427072 RepID=UPI00040CD954|nr:DMT family transporter [Alkalicoccus chagannorensis]